MNTNTNATLYINEPGTTVGISKNKVVVKKIKKVLFSMPKTQCERVIIAAGRVSISSDFIAMCADEGIAIDFLDRSLKNYLAILSTPKHAYARMTQLQLAMQNTPQQLLLATEFLRAKTKNQINYLRYLNKYHKRFDTHILKMRYLQKKLLSDAYETSTLMGYEGQISHLYWDALSLMLDGVFLGRQTKGATDVVNASLNYGYAILYGRIHYHALKAGLSLHISFLHSSNNTKPSLVFDMIEEFRTFVVDRVVFRMFNQNEPICVDKEGRLDEYSQKRIAKKVLDRLSSYTQYKNNKKEIDHIISDQAYLLARTINGIAKYRAFVGRY